MKLVPGQLTLADCRELTRADTTITLDEYAYAAIDASAALITKIASEEASVYGVNTGFGALATTKINKKDLHQLQYKLILSHAAGTGDFFSDEIVRLLLALKINSLARGYSGISRGTIAALITLYNAKCYPCIPEKGSVGASGDLAPLAHLSCALLGVGLVRYQEKTMAASDALLQLGLQPLTLGPKEGLALINGTQVSTALALTALFQIENVFESVLITGALSVEAARGSHTPFAEAIQVVRGQPGQIEVAEKLRKLLQGSEIQASHMACGKVQDPYSLRCQPQVMGPCLTLIQQASNTLLIEANAVSDNPLVFTETQSVLSGGNFHAQCVAFAADTLALALAEISTITERRIELLIDPHMSGLPPFLVSKAGLNSGFMIAQVTAAALTSENKSLAHPGSIDSIPTSANQEDHVSMATYAARRLHNMVNNTTCIVAIELLAACQGIDFLRPFKSSKCLEKVHALLRKEVPFYAEDRYFAPDIEKAKFLIQSGKVRQQL